MASDPPSIRWTDDLGAASWWLAALDDWQGRVSGLVPPGYAAYARVFHPGDSRALGALPAREAKILIDWLRDETSTSDRCWFAVAERPRLDDQGIQARILPPGSGSSYLLHGGPIDRALAPLPARRWKLDIPITPEVTPERLVASLNAQSRRWGGGTTLFSASGTSAEILEWLAQQPAWLPEESAGLWWPEDRAWFVATGADLATTYLGGSRGLIHRLVADARLEVREVGPTDDLSDAAEEALEREFGPVIARGSEGGSDWTLRGRIGADGVWSMMGGGGGGGGALPFQDLGWIKLGHIGSFGSSGGGGGDDGLRTLNGVVSRQTATLEVRLTGGRTIPAQIVDTGDPRATFFVAAWPGPDRWEALIARDASGRELEVRSPNA